MPSFEESTVWTWVNWLQCRKKWSLTLVRNLTTKIVLVAVCWQRQRKTTVEFVVVDTATSWICGNTDCCAVWDTCVSTSLLRYFPRYVLTSGTHLSSNNIRFNQYSVMFIRTNVNLDFGNQNRCQRCVKKSRFQFLPAWRYADFGRNNC